MFTLKIPDTIESFTLIKEASSYENVFTLPKQFYDGIIPTRTDIERKTVLFRITIEAKLSQDFLETITIVNLKQCFV